MGTLKDVVLRVFVLLSVFNGVYSASIYGEGMGTKEQTTIAAPGTGMQSTENNNFAASTENETPRPIIIDNGGLDPNSVQSEPVKAETDLNSKSVDSLEKIVQSVLLPGPVLVNADTGNVDEATGDAAVASELNVSTTNNGAAASSNYMTPSPVSGMNNANPAVGNSISPTSNNISGIDKTASIGNGMAPIPNNNPKVGTASSSSTGSGMAPVPNNIPGTGSSAPSLGSGMAPTPNTAPGMDTAATAMGSGMGSDMSPTPNTAHGMHTAGTAMGSGMGRKPNYAPGMDTAATAMGSGMGPIPNTAHGMHTAGTAMGNGMGPRPNYAPGMDTAATAMGSGMGPEPNYAPGMHTAATAMGSGMGPEPNHAPGMDTAGTAIGSGMGPKPNYVPGTGSSAPSLGSGMGPSPNNAPGMVASAPSTDNGMALTTNYAPGMDTAAIAMGSRMTPTPISADHIASTVSDVPAINSAMPNSSQIVATNSKGLVASSYLSPTGVTETTSNAETDAAEQENNVNTGSVAGDGTDLKEGDSKGNKASENKNADLGETEDSEDDDDDDDYDENWWDNDYYEEENDDNDDWFNDDDDWFDDDDDDDYSNDVDSDEDYLETSTTTKSWLDTSTTADDYDLDSKEDNKDYSEEMDDSVEAGKDLMTSGHNFDSSFGPFAGAKVSSKSRGLNDGFAYSWTLLLTVCIVIVGLFIFWNRHKVEKYIVSLRNPAPSNQNRGLLNRDEEKILLDNEYA